MTLYPEAVGDVNPYPEPIVIPYDPEDPDLPEPVDAPAPPERVHLTPDEAKANAAVIVAEELEAAPPGEPAMVTAYKKKLSG